MTRKVTITGFSLTDHRQNLRLWNKGIETMVNQCRELGSDRCFMVNYEKLVLQPKKTIQDILIFLHIPWVDDVLHHEELIGKRISLSKSDFEETFLKGKMWKTIFFSKFSEPNIRQIKSSSQLISKL